ncbi:MAG: hypothetical protein ABI051_03110 [Vicinamibacterales bacterium]
MTSESTTFETTIWQSLRHLWCHHRRTIITPKTEAMPAHVVCQACGWREPLLATAPKATRTWDSTRDEARYVRDKKRRVAAEEQRQVAVAQLSTPTQKVVRRRRAGRANVLEMNRAVGGTR